MTEAIYTVLMTWRLVRQLEEDFPDFHTAFDALQRSVLPALLYPDGSLEYEYRDDTQSLWVACMPSPHKMLLPISLLGLFRSLPPFQPMPKLRMHRLLSTKEHEKRIAHEVLQFGPGLMQDDYPQSLDLTDLHVNLQFHRRIRRNQMQCLATAVRKWHGSVSEKGMFDEGPIGRLSPTIEFQGLRAQFSFDASRTGQCTVNWLILSLLNDTYDVARLTAIVFNDVENLAKYGFEPSDEPIVHLPLADHAAYPDQAPTAVDPDSHLPAGLIPYPGLRSDHFTVWQAPVHEWESLNLTVYFEATPGQDQKKDFLKLLRAWSIVAAAGGFGGQGAPFIDDPVFHKRRRTAFVRADFGDADPDQAAPVLMRLLENYSSGTLGIEAIVFGRDPEDNRIDKV